jgi:hypothetical protein
MPRIRLRILPAVLLLLSVLIVGCGKEKKAPPTPAMVKLIDRPADDGKTVIIRWKHFLAGNAVKYEVYRGEDENSCDLKVAELSTQITVPAADTSSDNVFCDENYYIVLDKTQDPPMLDLVKATPENIDSISKIGEKVERVETSVVPNDTIKTIFAIGEFFRVNPGSKLLDEAEYVPLDGSAMSDDGKTLIKSEQSVTLALERGNREKDFIRNGRCIMKPGCADDDLMRKYVSSIASIVTANTRYSIAANTLQSIDADTTHQLVPGKEYFYKVVAISEDKMKSESKPVSITPVDDVPAPPANVMALVDSATSDIVLKWMTQDSDLKNIDIVLTTIKDTARSEGKVIESVNASWNHVKIKGIHLGDTSAIYLVAKDASYESKSGFAQSVPVSFKQISMPPDLVFSDYENDEALALAIRWSPPSISLSYRVTDKNRKVDDVKALDNLYFVEGSVVEINENLPEDARKLLSYRKETPSNSLDLRVFYSLLAHSKDKAGFARIKLEGNGVSLEKTDWDAMGNIAFDSLKLVNTEFQLLFSIKTEKHFLILKLLLKLLPRLTFRSLFPKKNLNNTTNYTAIQKKAMILS